MSQSISQSAEELKKHLEDQIRFLEASSNSYDAGFHGEAKRLAVSIRILLHDTRHSISLLGQLGMQAAQFHDTSTEDISDGVTTYAGLIGSYIGSKAVGGNYVPHLDSNPSKKVNFDTWWKSTIFVDTEKNNFSRKDLVLAVADQDGGAHVDPALGKKYAKLSRQNTLGRVYSKGGKWFQMEGSQFASIRQITHELLKTLKLGYSKSLSLPSDGFVIGDCKIVFGESTNDSPKKKIKVGRNKSCPCGSGIKFKKCCGKPS